MPRNKFKICLKCGEQLETTEFFKDKRTQDGLNNWCKKCLSNYQKQWKSKNPEKASETQRRYRRNNPEKRKQSLLNYRKTHPDKMREIREKGRVKYFVTMKLATKNWRQNNPDKRASYESKRRARKKDTIIEDFNLKEIYDRDNYVCQYCGIKTNPKAERYADNKTTHDHIIPLCRGGTHTKDNVVTACHRCNIKVKRGRLLEEIDCSEFRTHVS